MAEASKPLQSRLMNRIRRTLTRGRGKNFWVVASLNRQGQKNGNHSLRSLERKKVPERVVRSPEAAILRSWRESATVLLLLS